MENREGAIVSLREAGLRLAEICAVSLPQKASLKPPEARRGARKAEMTQPPDPAPDPAVEGSERRRSHKGPVAKVERNKPLGFQLTLDPEHPYLCERVPPELIDVFGLGYASRGLMAGRVCIPIHNADGELVAYAGRWAEDPAELPEREEKYKLPPTFHKQLELFNLHRVKEERHLVVVEGFFSPIRLHGLSVPAVALMGTALSEEQLALLRERCPHLKAVTILLDGDDAGRAATLSIVPRLARHWWTRIAELPEGAQPDTLPHEALVRLLHLER
jgi:hypothetical protein